MRDGTMAEYITVRIPTESSKLTVQDPLLRNQDLEELLDDIFRKKLTLPYEHREVVFVKTAIENLVLNIVSDIIDNKDAVFEVSSVVDLQANTDSFLCKIGSFYEQTKNTYPDQFDFVYIPFRYSLENTESSSEMPLKVNLEELRNRLDSLLRRRCLVCKDDELGEIEFDSFETQVAVLTRLRFCFDRGEGHAKGGRERRKDIYVDLVPGVRVIDPNLTENIEKLCRLVGFREQILETASMQYLWLPYSPTAFCESEVDFMLRILSKKHVKAYRLLKYLTTYHNSDDYDILADECLLSLEQYACTIPSYVIKTAMIIHHYECADDSKNIGSCLLGILKWFQQKFDCPIRKDQSDDGNVFSVELDDCTNQKLTLVSGEATMIKDAKTSITRLIDSLERYRKTTYGHALRIVSFSSHMIQCLIERQTKSRTKTAKRCAGEMGRCCYKIVILACVIALFLGILFGLILRKS